MKCPECERQLEDDAQFCSGCGTRLTADRQEPEEPAEKRAELPPPADSASSDSPPDEANESPPNGFLAAWSAIIGIERDPLLLIIGLVVMVSLGTALFAPKVASVLFLVVGVGFGAVLVNEKLSETLAHKLKEAPVPLMKKTLMFLVVLCAVSFLGGTCFWIARGLHDAKVKEANQTAIAHNIEILDQVTDMLRDEPTREDVDAAAELLTQVSLHSATLEDRTGAEALIEGRRNEFRLADGETALEDGRWEEAMYHLSQIPEGSSSHQKARNLISQATDARKAKANELQGLFREGGMDVDVSAKGSNGRTLLFRGAGLNRPTVAAIQQSDNYPDSYLAYGFSSIQFESTETRERWTLDPTDPNGSIEWEASSANTATASTESSRGTPTRTRSPRDAEREYEQLERELEAWLVSEGLGASGSGSPSGSPSQGQSQAQWWSCSATSQVSPSEKVGPKRSRHCTDIAWEADAWAIAALCQGTGAEVFCIPNGVARCTPTHEACVK